jgi:cytoskeletal protein CcmA (bactofilin family)
MERKSEIGASIVVRGEVQAKEDLIVTGRVEGTIEMDGHRLTVSQGADVKAALHARDIIVGGLVEGTLLAVDRVDLLATGEVHGEVTTPSIRMADGAILKGRVDMDKAVWSENARKPALQLVS